MVRVNYIFGILKLFPCTVHSVNVFKVLVALRPFWGAPQLQNIEMKNSFCNDDIFPLKPTKKSLEYCRTKPPIDRNPGTDFLAEQRFHP